MMPDEVCEHGHKLEGRKCVRCGGIMLTEAQKAQLNAMKAALGGV